MGQTRPQKPPPPSGDPFWDLIALTKRLLAPDGCPWDRAQTVESLLPCLIEETWEVFETVRSRDGRGLEEELGDLLYTVLFLAILAERQSPLRLHTLLRSTRQKMIRRHPHVFGATRAGSPQEAYRRWQAVKRREGAPRHSISKRLRPLLVEVWELLRRRPAAAARLMRTVGSLQRKLTPRGTPTGPSARPARARVRSPGPA